MLFTPLWAPKETWPLFLHKIWTPSQGDGFYQIVHHDRAKIRWPKKHVRAKKLTKGDNSWSGKGFEAWFKYINWHCWRRLVTMVQSPVKPLCNDTYSYFLNEQELSEDNIQLAYSSVYQSQVHLTITLNANFHKNGTFWKSDFTSF